MCCASRAAIPTIPPTRAARPISGSPKPTSRYLRDAAAVALDGPIGGNPIAAATAAQPDALLTEYMARRMQGYGLLQKLFKVFGLGWSRRLMATHAAALALLAKRTANPALPQNP
jgi:lysozyme family protein